MSIVRITEIHVEGLRRLKDVRLELGGLTVLIGENGAGKSSLIEACELIRRLANEEFLAEFYNPHGGTFALFRDGAPRLRIATRMSASLNGNQTTLEYSVSLARDGAGAMIEDEHLWIHYSDQSAPFKVIERDRRAARFWNGKALVPLELVPSTRLALAAIGQASSRHPAIDLVRSALRAIDVHLPFEVLPLWAARAYSRKSEIRGSILLQPAERLDLLGTNLANVYFALREQSDRVYWDDSMDLLRLGLGHAFEEVRSVVDPSGGAHALAVKWLGRDQPMTASTLSDGQLAFLAFVGIYRLPRSRTLLAIDEPELHLHPGLLTRVVEILTSISAGPPVLIATHSDRLLDALEDPVASIRICDLRDEATRLRRLDPTALQEWLDQYRGVGSLRSDGHLIDVLAEDP